jgi:hypothetical protein
MKRTVQREKENVKNAQKKIKKMKSVVKICAPKKRHELTEEETEDIMENLMNRLFTNYNIFGESKLNSNIEKIFENNMFQKLYNETDVLKEAFEDSENDNNSNIKNPKKSSTNAIKNKVLESQILNKNDISISKSFHESHFMMKSPVPSDDMFKKKSFEEFSPCKDIQ